MTYSDDILQAYLAGTLDRETSDALETAVAEDPALEARLMALDPFAAPIKQVFSDIPPASRLEQFKVKTETPTQSFAPILRYAAATLVGVAIGYGVFAGKDEGTDVAMGWKAQVANYQALYVADTVQNISSTPDELVTQFDKAEGQLGLDLQQAVLSQIPNLDLKRAQILGFNGKPLIQIAFEGENRTPIALCIIRNKKGEAELETETLAGLASASWSTGDHAFLLIGGTEQDAITETAKQLTRVF